MTELLYTLGALAFWAGLIVLVLALCKSAAIGDCHECGCECEDDPC